MASGERKSGRIDGPTKRAEIDGKFWVADGKFVSDMLRELDLSEISRRK